MTKNDAGTWGNRASRTSLGRFASMLGAHIALLAENSLHFFQICWAAQLCGLYYTAISTHLSPDEAGAALGRSGSR